MANYSGKLSKFVYDKWDKYKILKTLNVAVAHAKEKVAHAKEKTEAQITNKITNSTIPQNVTTVPSEPVIPIPKSLITWWQWYQYLVGLNTVEKARQEVILLQNKLMKCREIRRHLRQEAFINNNKTKEIYDELLRTKRDDPKYVSLTILENKALQEQSKNAEQLNLLEEEEKDYFVQLTTAINEYQDAQALNAQKYKYLSIVASAVAALLSLICSMIYNNKRINNIRQSMLELQTKNETIIVSQCNSLEESIDKKLTELESNLVHQNSKIMDKISRTPSGTQTVNEAVPDNGWLSTIRRSAYTVAGYVMLKGIIF